MFSYAVGERFERFIDEHVRAGSHASASEVVRAALALLEDRERARLVKLEGLRAEVQEGPRQRRRRAC